MERRFAAMPAQLQQSAEGKLDRTDRRISPLRDEPAEPADGGVLELVVAGPCVETDEPERVLEADLRELSRGEFGAEDVALLAGAGEASQHLPVSRAWRGHEHMFAAG